MHRSVVGVVVLAVACKSGGGGGGGGGDAPGSGSGHFITYTFNGTSYSGSLLANATLQPNGAGGNALGIEASDSTGDVLAIAVQPATSQAKIAVGTYMTAAAAPLATFQFTKGSAGSWAANGSGGTGSIDITALTATDIQGTFEATMPGTGSPAGSGTGALTDGRFDLAVP